MLVLLPPSETKRSGGREVGGLDLAALGYPGLAGQRSVALAATAALALDPEAMRVALGLSVKQLFEVERNAAIARSPVMAALDRYTGVLYDALDAVSLSPDARVLAAGTVVIHSALFGLLRADDPIPAYRMSHDSRLPGLRLKAHWSDAVASQLADHPGLILDLRSEAYVALGPVPAAAYFLRVVSPGPDGVKRALNHFNKKGKGIFVRTLLEAGIEHPDVESLLAWAESAGVRLAPGAEGELELTVDPIVAAKA